MLDENQAQGQEGSEVAESTETTESFFNEFFNDDDQFDINEEGNEGNEGTTGGDNQNQDGQEGGESAEGSPQNEGGQEGAQSSEGDGEGEGEGEGEGDDGKGSSDQNNEFGYVDHFEKYMQSLNPDYKAPDDIKKKENLTQEQIFSTFEKEIIKEKVQDPFVKNYLLRKGDKDFKLNDYIEENSDINRLLSVKDNREFLKEVYKKQGEVKGKNYSDEDIQKELDSMTEIKVDQIADQSRSTLKKNMDNYYKKQNDSILEKQAKQFENIEKENQTKLKTFFEEVQSKKRNLPIDMEEDEMSSFIKDAPKLIERDPETGMNIVSELLNDDDFFMDVLPFIYKKYKGTLENYQQTQKAKVKDIIKRNLRPGPSQSSRSSSAQADSTTAQNFFD